VSELQTERLRLIALDVEHLRLTLDDPRKVEENLGLQAMVQLLEGPVREAVRQMLDNAARDKENHLWHTLWRIVRKDRNCIIGGFDFKGPADAQGTAEVGYGIQPAHRGSGYMAEALQEAVRWALSHPLVSAVLAETEGSNPASHRVLEKVGFVRYRGRGGNGVVEDGTRDGTHEPEAGGTCMLKDLIWKNRSYRRFDPEAAVEMETLRELVDLARLSASASNKQPLKYYLACDAATNALIFPCLAWAGYLRDWAGPAEDERPTAYIVILGDTEIKSSFGCDHGIAAQSILLGATERELGGCIIGSVRREVLRKALNIAAQCEILLVLALGKPKESVIIESVGSDGDIEYWRDDDDVHHVPKRSLDDIVVS